jgi:sugar phosphate isomerase/epimerase
MFTSLNPGNLSFSAPFEEALGLAATNGYDGLDLAMDQLLDLVAETSIQDVKDRYQAAGVRPGAWGLPVDFRGAEDAYQRGMERLPGHAQLAQALGSPWCATWILPYSDELDFQANMERHATRLRPAARILAEHGCRLGLEFVGPATQRAGHRYEFIHTIAGALELGDRIGTGNVGLLLDSFHWYTAHGTRDDLARLNADQVVFVHVNDAVAGRGPDEQIDNQRMLPGATGVIDIAAFLQALQRMGYAGPVVVEPFNAELRALPAPERARLAAESLAKVWAQAGLHR